MRKWLLLASLILSVKAHALTDIAATDANVRLFGWIDTAITVPVKQAHGTDATGIFTFNGTKLDVQVYGNATGMHFSIDGAVYISTSPPNNSVLNWLPVVSGLSNTNHKVSFYADANNTFIVSTAAFRTDGTGSVADSTLGPIYSVVGTSFTSYGQIDGCEQLDGLGYSSPNSFSDTEMGYRYTATGSAQSFQLFNQGNPGVLYQDGVQVGSWTVPTASGTYPVVQITGLDPAQHEYEAVFTGLLNNHDAIVNIMPSGNLQPVVHSPRQCIALFGDSIVDDYAFYNSGLSNDSRLGWWPAFHNTGWALERQGNPGSAVTGGIEYVTGRITNPTRNKTATLVIHEGGVNDYRGSISTASFRVAVSTELYLMAQGLPAGSTMFWEGILPSNTGGTPAQYINAEQGGVADYMATAPSIKAFYYDTYTHPWISTTTDTPDGLHPVPSNVAVSTAPYGWPLIGYGKINNRLAPILAGWGDAGKSYSVTGPSSGAGGVASSPFTLVLSASATFTGDQTIIPNDGGAGGTFAPSTITPAVGLTSTTFTYTPSSAGTKNIGFSNTQDLWIDPSTMTYTVTSGSYSIVYPTSTVLTGSVASNNLGPLSFRVEARIHGFGIMNAGALSPVFSLGGFGIVMGGGSAPAIAANFPDTLSPAQDGCAVYAKGQTDLTIRLDRDVANMQDRLEVFVTTTSVEIGQCFFTITSLASSSTIQGNNTQLGEPVANSPAPNFSWIRWFNSSVAYGTPIPNAIAGVATLGDWEFEQNLNDSSGLGQNFTGSATYTGTPTYNPACNAGAQQSVAVGSALTLDASSSMALDNGTAVTYSWSYAGTGLDGVTQSPTITNATSVNPTVTGFTHFGSLNMNLTVTDSHSNSSSCVVHDGVVKTANAQGLIDETAEGLTPVQQFIVGPQVQYGKSQWPYIEQAIKTEKDLQLINFSSAPSLVGGAGSYYPYWRDLIQGSSITITAGTSTVVGVGTTFKSTFCSGGTSSDGSLLTWTYNGTDGIFHYGQLTVLYCDDDTHLTVSLGSGSKWSYPSSGSLFAPWPNCDSGCTNSYGRVDTGSTAYFGWVFGGNPANYYDNVEFFLVNYWRSGIDEYYQGATQLSKAFMEFPTLDYYQNCNYSTNNYSPGNTTYCFGESRNLALTGTILMEQQSGNSYLLPKIENVTQKYRFYMNSLPTLGGGMGDGRQDGYAISGIALTVLVDTNPAEIALDTTTLKTVMTTTYGPYHRSGTITGYTQFYSAGISSINGVQGGVPGSSVNVLNGSTTITGVGTSFQDNFANNTLWTFPLNGGNVPPYCDTCAVTGYTADGDTQAYIVTSVDVANQKLTIYPAYSGPTETGRGYAGNGTSGIVGWAIQPYSLGIFGEGFYHAAYAMTPYDSVIASSWTVYAHDIANQAASLISPDEGGVYNSAYQANCSPPMYNTAAYAQAYCYGANANYAGLPWDASHTYAKDDYAIYNGRQVRSLVNTNTGNVPSSSTATAFWNPTPITLSPSSLRQLGNELMRLYVYDYANFGSANYSIGTLLMNQAFTKPTNWNSSSTGLYLDGYDILIWPPGYYVAGLVPDEASYYPNNAKWAGQLAGFTEGAVTWAGLYASAIPPTLLSITGPIRITGNVTVK